MGVFKWICIADFASTQEAQLAIDEQENTDQRKWKIKEEEYINLATMIPVDRYVVYEYLED